MGLELGHVAGKLADAAVKMGWCSMGGGGGGVWRGGGMGAGFDHEGENLQRS